MKIRFTLFKKTFTISIRIESSRKAVCREIVKLILQKKILGAVKEMKANFDIGLRDAKLILDRVIVARTNDDGEYHYEFLETDKEKIYYTIYELLYYYERKI